MVQEKRLGLCRGFRGIFANFYFFPPNGECFSMMVDNMENNNMYGGRGGTIKPIVPFPQIYTSV
jgi:hypothetical protein